MIRTTKIGIVEDESIIADDLAILLEDIGYHCTEPCSNYTDAVAMLHSELPDLVLLDIMLFGKPDGIRLAHYVRNHRNIPVIFLTANSDEVTLAEAKLARPDAFLVKPFQKASLHTAIEVALHNFNFNNSNKVNTHSSLLKDILFIKEGEYFHKIAFEDILYLSSEHVYVTVHTTKRKFLVRATMQEYLVNFDPAVFFRVHRGYVANLKKIDKINSSHIIIDNMEVPLSKQYRHELQALLNLR
jgi:DNA-binding LytR/AlgR family response regulator